MGSANSDKNTSERYEEMNYEPGGWRIDLENFDKLAKLPNESPVLAMRGTYQAVTLDPREVIVIPNQLSVGSCQGHALTTCMEWCYDIQTGAADVQLSRAAAYYLSQEDDGIRGDNGSCVGTGCDRAIKYGIGEEKYWTYSGKYDPKKPSTYDEYVQSALNYRIGSQHKLTSYDGVATFLGAGLGGVEIGIQWNRSCDRSVIESYASGGGGHALALIALSDRQDNNGRFYVWLANSWGTGWGNKGWAEVSPTAIQQMLQNRNTVFIGLSDMPNIAPRTFSIDDWKRELRA